MSLEEVREHLSGEKEAYNKWVGVYIGVLAVLLAICNVGGGNAKDAIETNIAASDAWAFFQAKNIRRTSTALAANELELMLAAQPGIPDEVKRRFEDRINEYRADAQRLTSDPVKKEGLDELFTKAKRPIATWRSPKIPILTGARPSCRSRSCSPPCTSSSATCVLGLSGGLGALGLLLMLNGFTLLMRLPFIG